MQDRVLRITELKTTLARSDATIRRMVTAGTLPSPRQISPGVVGWLQSEINLFLKRSPLSDRVQR